MARRAGVGKSTIYLRWRDKDELLSDAVAQRRPHNGLVDTGSLRGDLQLLARELLPLLHGCSRLGDAADRDRRAGSPEPLGRFAEPVTDLHRETIATVASARSRAGTPSATPTSTSCGAASTAR